MDDERPDAADTALRADLGGSLDSWLSQAAETALTRDPDLLAAELHTAAEELRVVDDELRAQQAEVDRLLQDRHSLVASHERLVGTLPVPIVTTDDTGTITGVNVAAAAMLDRSVVALLRMPLITLVVPEDRRLLRTSLTELRKTGGDHQLITLNLRIGHDQAHPVRVAASKDHPASRQIRWVVVPASTEQRDSDDPQEQWAYERISAAHVAEAFGELWRLPLQGGHQPEILSAVTSACHRAFPDLTWVSVSLGDPAEPVAIAADSAEAQHLDGLQMRTGEGPCVETWRVQAPVVSNDLSQDTRWPDFVAAAAPTGVRSVLAVPILLGEEKVGAMSLYSRKESAFLAVEVRIAEWFASSVAAVLDDLRTFEELRTLAGQLKTALTSRAVIDQAKGIIMAQRHCTADEAFQHLLDLSSRTSVKVKDLSRYIVNQTQQHAT
jgi:PAS domain-containing protein